MIPNFRISEEGSVSDRFKKRGIDTFHDAARFVHNLPYGRNKRPEKPFTIIAEGRGTCSTKHACLKILAEENNINSIEFHMCVFPMKESNTPGVGTVLKEHSLDYILEVHTYLSYDNERYDFTFPGLNDKSWETDMLIETNIDADQIGEWKKNYHRNILQDWIDRNKTPYSLEELWSIREKCIAALNM